VDYQALNLGTIKNWYPLPLILQMLYQMSRAQIVTKLDMQNTYDRIRIKEGDKYKTAFRTWYTQFEYQIMRFGLINVPGTLQV
jgi:hypothetical protein